MKVCNYNHRKAPEGWIVCPFCSERIERPMRPPLNSPLRCSCGTIREHCPEHSGLPAPVDPAVILKRIRAKPASGNA